MKNAFITFFKNFLLERLLLHLCWRLIKLWLAAVWILLMETSQCRRWRWLLDSQRLRECASRRSWPSICCSSCYASLTREEPSRCLPFRLPSALDAGFSLRCGNLYYNLIYYVDSTCALFTSLCKELVTERTAPQFRRHADGICGKIQHGSNCLRNAGGTPLAAANSCVTDFFRDVYVERKNAVWCVAVT